MDRSTTSGDPAHAAGIPVLHARPGSRAERFAALLPGRHPVAVFFAALLSGLAAMVALSVLLGLLVTDVLVPTAGIGSADESFVHTLAEHRSGTETDASAVGSFLAGAPFLPALVGLIAIVFAIKRQWLVSAFAVFVLTIESATYRITTMIVPRERPDVRRLEDLPSDASYPSGHTAAAIAVYVGLVLLLTSRIRDGRWKAAAWVLAVALPIFAALSRMYRGMHHPLDVAGGAVIGCCAVLVLLFACRAAGVAAAAVRTAPARGTAPSSHNRTRATA